METTDHDLDQRMGRLLQIGVFTAAAVMLLGGCIYLFIKPEPLPDYKHFHATAESFRSIPRIFRLAAHGNAAALIQVGTFLMIATPVARVVFAAYAFGRKRDRLYFGVSCAVLLLLLYGLFVGN
jgi:uncharacterized membrane protein